MKVAESARTVYCIDTSALIDLKALYPEEVFPGVWAELDKLIEAGRMIAPKEVQKEIKKWDTWLYRWASKHKRMFAKLDKDQVRCVSELLSVFPDLPDPKKRTPDADPFLVALALGRKRKDKQYLFKTKYVVVTQEKYKHQGKPKIPNACEHYRIEWIPLTELLGREKWRF